MRRRFLCLTLALLACDDGAAPSAADEADCCGAADALPADAGVSPDGAMDAAPDFAVGVPDAAPCGAGGGCGGADAALDDAGPPPPRLGATGEPCPRGYALDCDPETTDRCVFLGADNAVVPGVEAVCSRACDDASPCGAGLCCFADPQGARCLPAGFCAGRRRLGDACADHAECPPEAPLCAHDAATGGRFCTHGCAAGGECAAGFCCAANDGGRPAGALCKPEALCPAACASDEDCPAVQFCDGGACVPRRLVCAGDAECPRGERCVGGTCQGSTARLGEACGEPGVRCDPGAPVCHRSDEGGAFCTYSCTFHRDCPATFCCADLSGTGDAAGMYCTDDPLRCPPNLPCRGDDDCAADQFCHGGMCQRRGPQDVPLGGACRAPGDCAPDAADCVFPFRDGQVGRGEARFFPESGAGLCSQPCVDAADCDGGTCCRLALQIRAGIGVGMCVAGDLCDRPTAGLGERCERTAECDPAEADRCFRDRLFGSVCVRPCREGCPAGTVCDEHDGLCHPENVCGRDADCADGNRCARGRCLEGRRECDTDAQCEDPVRERCFDGRCEPRARPCLADGECDAHEVCALGRCELRERPCAADGDCRAGEACQDGVCRERLLALGEACLDADAVCDPREAPICLADAEFAPAGLCTRACAYESDCPGDLCCLDAGGAGDPAFFVCGPPAACEGRAVGGRRPCAGDGDCLAEDYCHHGLCQDRGAGDVPPGGACAGPGDCAADQCVTQREFGFEAGAVDGVCARACDADADCGDGCCRHVWEDGGPVAYCVSACGEVAGEGELCFPGAHEQCDPATADACVFGQVSELSYCARRCVTDDECGDGCCGDGYCLPALDCR